MCLCEMGAIWIKTKKHIPILIPPFDYKDIKGVFPSSNGMKINNKNKLNSLKELLEDAFQLTPLRMTIWERRRDKFLLDINSQIGLLEHNSIREPVVGDTIASPPLFVSKKDNKEELKEKDLEKDNSDKISSNTISAIITKLTLSDPFLANELRDYMIEIPAGEFLMGDENKGPVKVNISKPFFMAKHPVKQTLFQYITNNNPSHFSGEELPVENISWFDAIYFCNKLSKICSLDEVYSISDNGKNLTIDYSKYGFRLPTEAEWEYACNINSSPLAYNNIGEIAWHLKNSDNKTHQVGNKKPNKFGLFDMLGNVWEWCNDWFNDDYLVELQKDQIGPKTGIERVLKGGSWVNPENKIHASIRNRADPYSRKENIGFRIVLSCIE